VSKLPNLSAQALDIRSIAISDTFAPLSFNNSVKLHIDSNTPGKIPDWGRDFCTKTLIFFDLRS
jgi:hypothetical protein